MLRAFHPSLFAAFGLAAGLLLGLGGCAPGPVFDRLPESMGGLPAGAPERPKTPYQYPAVHDMPPPRANPTMNATDQIKLEKELQAARDRLESKAESGKKAAPTAKKKPAGANNKQTSGAKTNP